MRNKIFSSLNSIVLVALGLLWAMPLLWSIALAFRPPNVPISIGSTWWGGSLSFASIERALDAAPFATYYRNTLIVVFGILVVQMLTITLAGFVFARLKFSGRDWLFLLFMLQLLVPIAILIIPNYATIRSLGLFNNLIAIMLPFWASAFGTFLMRQTFRTVPLDYEDAAKIDGANWWQTLWHVYIPPARPALAAFALVSLSSHWNDFLWPLVVTNSVETRTLTVGLASFTQMSESGAEWSLIMAGTLLVVWPLLVLFLVFQRQFIASFVQSGLK
ncbi:MAG: carbohydrate ABC transporter permease [Anaerolineae bacterium]|nr:carbohydrate ABC transporter permease [Anaerolineae bacterium]